MNYGQAIEAMKRGGTAWRDSAPDAIVFIAHHGTPLEYMSKITPDGQAVFQPTTRDQLAEDWLVSDADEVA
jgi:predicted HAD superfamily Cof-like phosphohydrolase